MRAILTLALVACLNACVPVPYSVEPEVDVSKSVVLPSEDILVTLGPRTFLEKMEAELAESAPQFQIVNALTFRDVAFPQGEWSLSQLLLAENLERIQQQMKVNYLVLFGPLISREGTIEGPSTLSYGIPVPVGVGHVDSEAAMSALIINLVSGTIVCQVDVSAEGTATIISYVYSLVPYPETGVSTVEGMVESIAERIRTDSTSANPPVVLMAAEGIRLWKPIGAGGWTPLTSGKDEPVTFRVFDICGLADAQVTLLQAYERAMDYYRAENYNHAYTCFQFVIDAGDSKSGLVEDANRYRQFMRDTHLVSDSNTEHKDEVKFWTPGSTQ